MTEPIVITGSAVEIFDPKGKLLVRFDLQTENGRRDALKIVAAMITEPVLVYRRGERVRGLPGYALAPVTATRIIAQIARAVNAAA